MNLPDTNVLVYAAHAAAPQHGVAKRWLEASFDSARGVALTWSALTGFVRLTTHPRVMDVPLPVVEALRAVHDWLAAPRVVVLQPGTRHELLLGRLLLAAGTAGNLTNDAHIAALAIEHGATVGSFDRDFSRFAGLSFEHLTLA